MSEGLKLALALIVSTGAAAAAESRCAPALPVFCANVHVGCAGRTTRPTSGFLLGDGVIAFDDGAVWTVTSETSGSGDVYRRTGAPDWIRVDPEGRFSQRVYLERGPVMAYGVCE